MTPALTSLLAGSLVPVDAMGLLTSTLQVPALAQLRRNGLIKPRLKHGSKLYIHTYIYIYTYI
jgi:hypothetical protein